MTGSTDTIIFLERRWCVKCSKNEAHAHCTLCHHYFHDVPKLLLEGKEKLITFPQKKRTLGNGPVYCLVENTCFCAWHANGRAKAWRGSRCGAVPQGDSVHYGPIVGIGGVVDRRERRQSRL